MKSQDDVISEDNEDNGYEVLSKGEEKILRDEDKVRMMNLTG